MWSPGQEGSSGENEYMYMYGWVPLLYTWTIITLLICYTPMQNKNFLKKKIGAHLISCLQSCSLSWEHLSPGSHTSFSAPPILVLPFRACLSSMTKFRNHHVPSFLSMLVSFDPGMEKKDPRWLIVERKGDKSREGKEFVFFLTAQEIQLSR